MKKIDRVRPVKRYRAAKYPSHADPDPTTHPAPVPFPFHRELVRAVAGVGLAASLGFATQQAPPASPFQLAKSGLPHRTSSYGTGAPSYLSDEMARGVIEKVFKEGGFALKRDVVYDKDGLSFKAGGYDPERRVGYVYGTSQTLDLDAYQSWMLPEATAKDLEDPEKIRTWLRLMAPHFLSHTSEDLRKLAAQAPALPDGEALIKAYRELRAAFGVDRLSLVEMKHLEDRALKNKEFIAVVSQFDARYLIRGSWESSIPKPMMDEIYREKDALKRGALVKAAVEGAAKDKLALLERNVREFLAWARANGL